MQESSKLYVAYSVAQQQRKKGFNKLLNKGYTLMRKPALEDSITQIQQTIIDAFLNSSEMKEAKVKAEVIKSFYDTFDSRKTAKWPQLLNAIAECKQTGATLLITELGTLPKSESFAESLLNAGIQFHCYDQPRVNFEGLLTLSQNAQLEKSAHGKLIKEGLKQTSAKSGNPNAAQVIGEVNKPKIHTAIVFAFILEPILDDHISNGYSQRDMVKRLNDEGFTAPEGGTWVLSQFQKVLERVRLNKVATTLQPLVQEFMNQALGTEAVMEHFNTKGIASLKRTAWDEQQVKKLQERVQQIQDIVLLNRFVLSLLPLLHDYQKDNMLFLKILTEFSDAGIPIRYAPNLEHPHETHKAILVPPHRRVLLEQLKRDVMNFPENASSLEAALESTMKHLPAYLTIVKTHIEQLAKVLKLENHKQQELSEASLAEPVSQLIRIFQELKEEDFQTLEGLFFETVHWETEATQTSIEMQTEVEA